MRLWFTGWEREDFGSEPKRYLETEQRQNFAAYGEFAAAMHGLMRPGGVLVMHLGETAKVNMAEELSPLIEAPTTTTAATPMMIPIKVRKARSLCSSIDREAIQKAS